MINIAIKLATSITYTADGSQTNFSVPFDYLRPSFVHVSVNDAEVSEGFTISNRMIMFDAAPAKDAVVRIYRNTPTTRLVSWVDASILKAIDMTIAEVQQLHILEEASDWSKTNSIVLDEESGVWQGRKCRVSNVADPTEAQDVVTKNYLENTEDSFVQRMNTIKTQTEQFANTAGNSKDSAYKSAQSASASAASAAESARLAEGYKTAAETAKSNASLYAANAKTSADNAGASKEAAQSAATAASNFASAARNSAGEAKTYKDNAKTYMDNAELYMNNAKNYSENVNVFVPSVSSAGVLSWTNKAGLPNPASVNIKGVKGDAGTAATITIGSVTTDEPGTNASVTNSGTSTNAILNFTIPRGNPGSGGGTSVEVDAALSDTSLNPVQNKVIKAALDGKLNTTDTATAAQKLTASKVTAVNVGRPIVFFSNDSGGAWLEACYDTNFKYNTVTKDLTVGTINGVDVTAIDTTYAKKTDISGVVKSVNGTAPDASGNVTITATGGVSTSSANTWTAVQEFYNTKTFRACHTGYFVEGTSDTPVTDTMWYTTNGDFTLNLSNFAMLLGTYESIVFSAYFTADADHALTISGAGTMTYIGSASDIAISGSGTLLTVWMIKNPNGVVSIVQAHKLGSGT